LADNARKMVYRKIPITFIVLDKRSADLNTVDTPRLGSLTLYGATIAVWAIAAVIAVGSWRARAYAPAKTAAPAIGWCWSTVDPEYCGKNQ